MYSRATAGISKYVAALLLSFFGAHAETGSAVCAGCHADIVRSYAQTGMARSSGPVVQVEKEGQYSARNSTLRFRVYRDKDRVLFNFNQGEARGARQLEYFIGSGLVGRTYIFRQDKFLYEAPVSWYASAGRWDLSPGYEQYDRFVLTRPVQARCLQCHSSQVQSLAGTQNGYLSPPFLEGGVACERCHGDAAEHVASGGSIVNPVKLSAERRDSICEQCHLTGVKSIARPGAKPFRPGERLAAHSVTFVWADTDPDVKATSHFEKLARSQCKIASGDRLWCGTCHNPHRAVGQAEQAAFYRTKCLGCHQEQQCKRGFDCAGCHMPKTAAHTVPHSTYTDHTIHVPGRAPSGPGAAKQGHKLIAFGGAEAGDRELGLAYAEIPGFEDEAIGHLERAPQEDPDVLAHLGSLWNSRGEYDKAIPLYAKALRADPSQVTAAVNLATLYMRRNEFPAAISLLQQALERSPGLQNARLSLAVAQYQTGDVAAAEASLTKLLEMDPGATAARRVLNSWKSEK
jgi:predicted CXXCH cytochrome family protein